MSYPVVPKHHARSLPDSKTGNCPKAGAGDTYHDGAHNTHCSTAQELMRNKQATLSSRSDTG